MAIARQVAMYLARELTDHSLPEIGRGVGGRNHTTVMHAITRVGEAVRTDSALRGAVDNLRSRARPARVTAAATATIHSLRRFSRQAPSRAPRGIRPACPLLDSTNNSEFS